MHDLTLEINKTNNAVIFSFPYYRFLNIEDFKISHQPRFTLLYNVADVFFNIQIVLVNKVINRFERECEFIFAVFAL